MNEGFWKNSVYWLAQISVTIWLKIRMRFESHGSQNVPLKGGCILAANHSSFLDPPVVGCGLNHRIVHFMARDSLYKPGFMRWFLLQLKTFPIDRNKGDVAALRKAITFLREGKVVALFPEGTRSSDGNLQEAKGGIGFLIAKAAVPVVPTYIDGTFRALPRGAKKIMRSRIRIIYGKPITLEEMSQFGSDRSAYEQLGNLVMSRIASLKPLD
ncbi:MAG: lysophospholipid acyltransferase family protein [Lentisphaerota bacterium]